LISGFFTMMMLRKRGLQSLLSHRLQRIFLPLVLALFTIIPLTWAVSAYVGSKPATKAVGDAQPLDIWRAAAKGDNDRVAELLDGGTDVNVPGDEGSTPLMIAALFGRAETSELLIERGADPSVRNNKGERVSDMLQVPWNVTTYVAGLLEVDVQRREVDLGRARIAAMLPASPSGLAEKSPTNTNALANAGGVSGLVALLTYFPLYGHLWFLHFLCWLVAGFAIWVWISPKLRLKRLPDAATLSPARYMWLIPLTMIPQAFMGREGAGFGPDTSIGLLPMPSVLAYYAIFFGFGAIYYDASDSNGRVGRRWWATIPLSVFVLLPIGLLTMSQHEGLGRLASVFVQVCYVWFMSFGLMGLFRSLLSRESKTMRYLSDSSYWLYLAHIPVVLYLQYLVRDYDVSSWLKLVVITSVASAFLLLSYQLFIRYSPIGTMLNGPRHRNVDTDSMSNQPIIEATLVPTPHFQQFSAERGNVGMCSSGGDGRNRSCARAQ
jgi:peptidoglycan/LPS O-acetylase OafA/YrhL